MVRAVAISFATAAIGWAILLFGLVAESDTGLPDGLACTGRLADSAESYEACMRQEENRTMIAWGVAAGLAAVGVVMLVRSRRPARLDVSQRVVTGLAGLASVSLAAAAGAVWIHGAGGGFYDDSFGPGRWCLTMGVGVAVGAVAGRVLSIGLRREVPTSPGPASPSDRRRS